MLFTVIICSLGALNALALPLDVNLTKVSDTTDTSHFLPDTFIPESYDIEIDVTKSFIEIEEGIFRFTGKVEIIGNVDPVDQDINEIRIHAAGMQIDEKNIKVKSGLHSIPIKSSSFDIEREFLIITFNELLTKGKHTITIESYTGTLYDDQDMHGFYVSRYKEKNNSVPKYVLTTQFQPTSARRAFPCFDEPRFKATFKLSFKKQSQYKVLSNMKSNEANHGVGQTLVTFPETPRMSSYLVAFIIGEFESAPSPVDKDYNVWARPEAVSQTKWATDYMHDIIQSLNKFTGIDYNSTGMTKMDMAAIPDFSAGAMENWGLLTYRETALLVDEDVSTTANIQGVITVIAHEIAHQWFGNLITCHWWMNAWLNEGFATYFEYHTTADVIPEWEMDKQFVLDAQQGVFGVDALASTTPLTRVVETPAEVSSHFGSITYSKGGSVIRMMKHILGQDIFQKSLQKYLDQNRYKNTEPKDLLNAIQQVIDENKVDLEFTLSKIMTNWITTPGYPVISVNSGAKGFFTLSQQRFFLNPKENEKNKQYWFVPISYTTSDEWKFTNTMPKLWLTPKEPTKTIAVDSDFMILNVQESGYYRVNYDTELWQRIADALASSKGESVHALNKAQLVDDVLNLARADMVDYPTAFNVTDFLATETNFYPWSSVFANFRFLLQRYSDADDTGMELRMYLKSLMVKIRDLEFKNPKESHIDQLSRVQALEWACNLEHDNCISEAKALFKGYRTSGSNKKIPVNLRPIVYCTGLRHGDNADWDFLWGKYTPSNSAAEKKGILNALGCSTNEKKLESYLKMSINSTSGIRKQDASYVFSAVYIGGNAKGVNVAFKFLKDNNQQIINNYNGKDALERVTLGLAARLTEEKQITAFKALLKDSNFALFRQAAIDIVDQNQDWTKKYSDTIHSVLNKKRTGAAAGIFANKYVVVFLAFISVYFSFLQK